CTDTKRDNEPSHLVLGTTSVALVPLRHLNLSSTRNMSHPPLEILPGPMGDGIHDCQEFKSSASVLSPHGNQIDGSGINEDSPRSNHLEISLRSPGMNDKLNISDSIEIATSMPLPESTSTILLQNLRSSETSGPPLAHDNEAATNVSALAPVDGGVGAWSYVCNPIITRTMD
ncbi:223_t:CDS:1, partial [Acaulospora colombiana]